MQEGGLNDLGAAIALGDHLIQLAAPRGYEGEFRGHEEPVQCDEAEDGKETARSRGARRRMGRLRSNKYKEHIGCNLYSSRDLGSRPSTADN